jgi:hypothetical protein
LNRNRYDGVARSNGAHILGPVASVRDAQDIAEGAIHLNGAVVDLKLRGGMAFSVAEALLMRGTPFVVTTAYDEAAIPARFGKIVACPKPANTFQIVGALFG